MTAKSDQGFSFSGVNPCTGDAGILSFTVAHEIFHVNVNGAGDAWLSGTDNGTTAFTPDNAGAPTGQGPWVSWFGFSLNKQNSVEHATFSFRVNLSNGQTTMFHETQHVSFTPNGPAVSFDKPIGSCA